MTDRDSEPGDRSFKVRTGGIENSQVTIGNNNKVIAQGKSPANGPGGSTATEPNAAASGDAKHRGRLERAKHSLLSTIGGAVALLATAAATGLLIFGVTNIGIAGYILAVIAIFVGSIPLFSSK
jgi:hypothetical protein